MIINYTEQECGDIMKYIELDKKVRELEFKWRALHCIAKDQKVDGEKSMELNKLEDNVYKKYLFYKQFKKAFAEQGGDNMACGTKKGGKKR